MFFASAASLFSESCSSEAASCGAGVREAPRQHRPHGPLSGQRSTRQARQSQCCSHPLAPLLTIVAARLCTTANHCSWRLLMRCGCAAETGSREHQIQPCATGPFHGDRTCSTGDWRGEFSRFILPHNLCLMAHRTPSPCSEHVQVMRSAHLLDGAGSS